jgi:uncharacterized protein (TIGR02266 family)
MEPIPLVLPIRFSGGGLSMQTTTSRVGLDRAFVRATVSPKDGAALQLQLSFPGAVGTLPASGKVRGVQHGGAGKDAGFWVEFDSLPGPAGKALRDALEQQGAALPESAPAPIEPPPGPRAEPSAGPPPEPGRRTFPRANAKLGVRYSTARDFLVAYSENISRGGIFVATPQPPEVGTQVELWIKLPDADQPVRTQAVVMQRTTPEEAQATGRRVGAGLQFTTSDDSFRERLDRCIENLLAAGG